ncbi:MAG: acetyl-CoA carboxylase carboxyltransferase subunit alpha [Alphaproteobacteria bacterium]|nr:acetyl-CoA carboxylase carboxyltransferase subunit alpha [Alphaproteobacteria bacterium]
MHMLDFEKPILELEHKIAELRNASSDDRLNIAEEISRMEKKAQRLIQQTYSKLTPAQKVKVARHPNRPHLKDYISQMIEDFTPLAGDRLFGEDQALIGGLGRFNGQSVVVMGQEKGDDTDSRIKHNFGMARPEGYRKAQRLMKMAEQFNIPVITLVDTAGAYPGLGAEERGQSEAIAKSIEVSLNLKSPIVATIIGEGGSGGAIAIATADKVIMLEHSIYSVISPEGCASILWRSADYAKDAAGALKLTADDMLKNRLIDAIVKEPLGGAQRQKEKAIRRVQVKINESLQELNKLSPEQLVNARHAKFLQMGRDVA